jgi:hypothetical protein
VLDNPGARFGALLIGCGVSLRIRRDQFSALMVRYAVPPCLFARFIV